MCKLYQNIENLCKDKKVSITQMCKDIDVSRASLTDYKMGRIKSLSVETLNKIAKYFNVSFEYLLGEIENKQLSAKEQIKDVRFALSGEVHDITEEEAEDVLNFLKYIKSKRQK